MPLTSAPQVVLLHGWASHPTLFRGFARRLEKKCHVLVLPLPGYCDTAACVPYTLERIADTLAAAAPRSCCVVGWSLGAQVALTWAQRRPQQVQRLVLIAGTPCFTQHADWRHGVTAQVMRQFTAQLQRDGAGLLRRFVALQAHGDARAVRVAHQLRTALFTHPLPPQPVLEAGLELLRSTDLRTLLRSIRQPTLVLHGAQDAVTPVAAGVALSEALVNARLHTITDAGHAPFLSDGDGVAAQVDGFSHEAAAAV